MKIFFWGAEEGAGSRDSSLGRRECDGEVRAPLSEQHRQESQLLSPYSTQDHEVLSMWDYPVAELIRSTKPPDTSTEEVDAGN